MTSVGLLVFNPLLAMPNAFSLFLSKLKRGGNFSHILIKNENVLKKIFKIDS